MSRSEWKVSLPREAAPLGRTHMAFAAKFSNGRVESYGHVPTDMARLIFTILCVVKPEQIAAVTEAVIAEVNKPSEPA
jgi:hypothetical protein